MFHLFMTPDVRQIYVNPYGPQRLYYEDKRTYIKEFYEAIKKKSFSLNHRNFVYHYKVSGKNIN